jgi:hypothetical protein
VFCEANTELLQMIQTIFVHSDTDVLETDTDVVPSAKLLLQAFLAPLKLNS